MREIILSLLLLSAYHLYSQAVKESQDLQKSQAEEKNTENKPSFDIQEELIEDMGAKEQLTPEEEAIQKEEESNIIIQGKDELLVRSRKKPSKLIEPIFERNLAWDTKDIGDNVRSTTSQSKKRKTEKLVNIEAFYGLYNNLQVNTSITKGTSQSAHSIVYQRTYKEGEGADFKTIGNSDLSLDQMITTNAFKISDIYRLFVRGYYLQKVQGLQANTNFDQQKQKAWFLETDHLFALPEQKVRASLQGHHIDSETLRDADTNNVEAANSGEKGRFTSFKLKTTWDYFFTAQNSLGVKADFWLAENQLYYGQKKQYIQGKPGGWILIPVYTAFMGEESIPFNVHFKVGVYLFISEGLSPIPIPVMALESRLGVWQLTLGASRHAATPDITEKVLRNDFFKPVHFNEPENYWKIYLENQLTFKRGFHLVLEAGYLDYSLYYYPDLDSDGLYFYNSQTLNLFYGILRWEHSPFKFLQYALGIQAEAFLNSVFLRPSLYLFSNIYLSWKKLGIDIKLRFAGKRETPEEVLSQYILLDLGLYYELTSLTRFYFETQNTLNQRYTLLPPYQTSGIIISGGFRLQI